MAFIAQRRRRLSGHLYEVGEPVPDEVVHEGAGPMALIGLGIVSSVPDAAVAGIQAGAEAAVEAFDPGRHTVKEVLAYLEAHPDQARRVYEAEVGGDGRKGVLGPIEESMAAPGDSGGGDHVSGSSAGGDPGTAKQNEGGSGPTE